MPKVPLFTETELATAFRWLLPDSTAVGAAHEWFAQFADEVDDDGYFLYLDGHELTGVRADLLSALATTQRVVDDAERVRRELAYFAAMTTSTRLEVLMRFSDFHVNLVSLVSPEAAERIRRGFGLTAEQIKHRQSQMRRIVAAMRATRGDA